MDNGFQAQVILDQAGHGDTAHAHTSHGTIGNIDTVHTCLLQQSRPFQNLGRIHLARVEAARRIEFDADDEFPCGKLFLQSCGRALPR